MSRILFQAISPFLRYARENDIYIDETYYFSAHSFCAYDNRLLYIISGQGFVEIDGVNYPVGNGSLLLWGAGQTYRYHFNRDRSLQLIAFNFDYTKKSSSLNQPILPDVPSKFIHSNCMEEITFEDTRAFDKPILLTDSASLYGRIQEINIEFKYKKSLYAEKCSGLLLWLLADIAVKCSESILHTNHEASSALVDAIIAYIQDHFTQGLTNDSIGEAFHYHPYYINKLMVRHTGVTLHKYLQNYRITQAIHLIQNTRFTISEISNMVGFSDLPHFSRYFKQQTGRKPCEYRQVIEKE